jgi:hypothetical protein
VVSVLDAPEVDQAVFDAEFVAIVLAEYPGAEGEPVPASIPPRSGSRSRRADRPGPTPTDRRRDRAPVPTAVRSGRRRRPGPSPRSPPP